MFQMVDDEPRREKQMTWWQRLLLWTLAFAIGWLLVGLIAKLMWYLVSFGWGLL